MCCLEPDTRWTYLDMTFSSPSSCEMSSNLTDIPNLPADSVAPCLDCTSSVLLQPEPSALFVLCGGYGVRFSGISRTHFNESSLESRSLSWKPLLTICQRSQSKWGQSSSGVNTLDWASREAWGVGVFPFALLMISTRFQNSPS